MSKHLLLATAIFFAFFSAKSQTNVSGNISGNTTWTKTGSPYILTGNLGVRSDFTLTIEPGVIVRRTGDFQILINGAVKIDGTAADSIQFVTDINPVPPPKIFPFAPDTRPFIEFQKSKLDNSSLSYVSFWQSNYQTNHVRLGNESSGSQTNPKNSGTLAIAHSDLNNGFVTANNYSAQAHLFIDSSSMNNGSVYAYSAYGDSITVTNSQVINSFIWSSSSNSISLSNCYLGSDGLYLQAYAEILNCTVENSKGDPLGSGGMTVIKNSNFTNTYFNYGFTSFEISDSKFTVNDKLVDQYGNSIPYLLNVSQGFISNVQFVNNSSYALTGIYINGDYNGNYGYNTLIHNSFENFYDAVTVNDFKTIRLDSNNFYLQGRYDINNQSKKDFSALYNYYQLSNSQTIDDLIFDQNDDLNYGLVTYTPYLTGPVVLPVSLLNITGKVQGKAIVLNWKTGKEVNIANYIIERKLNNGFTAIGTVAATSNSGDINSYHFTDYTPAIGTNYYRLKTVDKNEKNTYSLVVPVLLNPDIVKWYIYPNPAKNYVVVEHKAAINTAQIELADMEGRIVKTVIVAKENTQTKLNVTGIAKGTYKIVWREGNKTESQTVLIQ